MNIVFAANIFPPEIGGPATYVEALARYMHEMHHTVSLVCFSAYSGIDRSYPFPVHRIGLNRSKIAAHVSYFLKLASLSKKADLIYAQGPVAGGVQASLLARLRKATYFIKVTGDYAWEQAASDSGLLASI
ncbi:MAG: glycosyltransferase, partial [Patescibacteria group bacterium]